MSNWNYAATCAVCRRPNQGAFTSGPLEGFCERCAWHFDSRRLEIETAERLRDIAQDERAIETDLDRGRAQDEVN